MGQVLNLIHWPFEALLNVKVHYKRRGPGMNDGSWLHFKMATATGD